MALQLSIAPLPRVQAAQALPLVRSLRPDLTLEEWQSYLDLLGQNPVEDGEPALSGVMAVRDQSGYLHGLFTFSVAEDIVHGRALTVDNMIAVDMLGRDDSARLMIAEMDKLARTHRCGAVHVTLAEDHAQGPRPVSAMMARLRSAGHHVDGVRLCRLVAETATTASAGK